jgi:hypothetical protein
VGGNKIKKLTFGFSIFFLSVVLVSSQSLVEVARKERARRAALRAQGKTSVLVTNTDLKRGYKRPKVATKPETKTTQRSARRSPTRTQRPATQRPTRESTSRQQPSQQEERLRDPNSEDYMSRKYATKVLLASDLVKNPDYALKKPDQKYAEISFQGMLELEVDIKNGSGADVAIYSKLSGIKEITSGNEEEGGIPETYGLDLHEGIWYGVLALNKRGEWEALGRGRGGSVSEKFDLGRITSTKRIRIIFKPLTNPELPAKRLRIYSRELLCSIDAVETLH